MTPVYDFEAFSSNSLAIMENGADKFHLTRLYSTDDEYVPATDDEFQRIIDIVVAAIEKETA